MFFKKPVDFYEERCGILIYTSKYGERIALITKEDRSLVLMGLTKHENDEDVFIFEVVEQLIGMHRDLSLPNWALNAIDKPLASGIVLAVAKEMSERVHKIKKESVNDGTA